MVCENATCYLVFVCYIKDRAENCSLHKQFLKGEPVIQFSAEDIMEIAEHQYVSKYLDSSKVEASWRVDTKY